MLSAQKKMPDIFVKSGHGVMVIDCTEFTFQHAKSTLGMPTLAR